MRIKDIAIKDSLIVGAMLTKDRVRETMTPYDMFSLSVKIHESAGTGYTIRTRDEEEANKWLDDINNIISGEKPHRRSSPVYTVLLMKDD